MILIEQGKMYASDVKTRIHFRRRSSKIYKKEHAFQWFDRTARIRGVDANYALINADRCFR